MGFLKFMTWMTALFTFGWMGLLFAFVALMICAILFSGCLAAVAVAL